jgi:hypothetical protein
MIGRSRSRVLALVALVAAVLAGALGLGADAQVLLWMAPAILLVAPLLFGRFVGEGAIAARRRLRPRERVVRRAAVAMPRRTPRVAGHHGLLLAFALAKRGPPAAVRAI